jgi:hypothetical protein
MRCWGVVGGRGGLLAELQGIALEAWQWREMKRHVGLLQWMQRL